MDNRINDVIAQHGNWLDVLCYTFRAVSDPIKALWIIIPCLTLVLCVYFITTRKKQARTERGNRLYPEKKQPHLPLPDHERLGFYQAEKQKEVL